MPIVSISLTRELLRRLDDLIRERGYSSRSEAIRDAIRSSLSEYDLSRFEEGRVAATITAIFEYEKHDVGNRLMRLRHEYGDLIASNLHTHITKAYCLEVFVAQGEVKEVLNYIGRVRTLRGIHELKYTVIPIIEDSE
ncbi:MAG: nickel-responsive transcriptional regulator NikR [Candidatus Bathyarchaeia archaeon]